MGSEMCIRDSLKTETRPRRLTFKTETRRDVPKNVSRPPRDRDVQDRDYIPVAGNGDIVICIRCRVTRNENLFYGNMAPGSPPPDPSIENQASFCLCDRPHESDQADVNRTAVCGRRAVSDTTADSSEPQRNVRLGVPRVIVEKRRRKRQTPGRGANGLTSSQRIYQTDYKYVSRSCDNRPDNKKHIFDLPYQKATRK